MATPAHRCGRSERLVPMRRTSRSARPLLAFLNAPVNSDFRPFLQIEAPRARFAGKSALAALDIITSAPLPIHEMLADPRTPFIEARVPLAHSERVIKQNEALEIYQMLVSPDSQPLAVPDPSARLPLLAVKQNGAFCGATIEPLLLEQLHWIAERTLPHLAPARRRELWVDARWRGCDPARTVPAVRERLALYRAISERDATAMHARATDMLTRHQQAGADWRRFLLSTAMLGAFASDRRDEALGLWATYSGNLYPEKRFPPDIVYLANWGR